MKSTLATDQLPLSFKPLLWSLKWEEVDVDRDKADIILNTINEGTLDQWQWLKQTYGKPTIRTVLSSRLKSELHPESRRLATLWFNLPPLCHAR